jgi:hypothetical protein
MAIDRIPAGVADTADKPAAIDAGIGIEHPLWALDPIDVLGGLAPKCLRVALPAAVGLVIAAHADIHGAAPYLKLYADRTVTSGR